MPPSELEREYPGGVPCVEHLKITNKLVAQMELHGQQVRDVADQMSTLQVSNGDCARALGQMYGSIPRMEECLKNIFDRLGRNEVATGVLKDVRGDVKEQNRRIDKVETAVAINKTRQSLIWGVVAGLFGSVAVIAVKFLIG